jgi:hypothetical protein
MAVTSSGTTPDGCIDTIDGSKLMHYADGYYSAMMCGITYAGIDRVLDTAVTVSGSYYNRKNQELIVAQYITAAVRD